MVIRVSVKIQKNIFDLVSCILLVDKGSVAILWRNAKRKCKFADKRAQANVHCSKWLSLGFTLHFAFCQNKATEPLAALLYFDETQNVM